MQRSSIYSPLDLKAALSENRLIGLWRLIAGFRWIFISAIVSLALATAARSGSYLLLQHFVDDALIKKNVSTPLAWFALAFVGLAVVQGVFTFLSGKLAAHGAEGSILRLRNYLFDHIQRLSFSYHDKSQTGELVQRCSSDVDTIRRFFADQAIGVGRIILLFIVNWIALLSLNLKLGLLAVITMPIVLTISIFFFRKIHAAYELHQEQEGALSTVLQENLSGVRVVKAFARQRYEVNKFETTNHEQFERGKYLLKLHSFFWPLTETISGAQMLFVFFMGARMAINGEITVGTYLAAAGLVIWIIWPMQNLGRLIVQTSMSLVSYTRVAEILAEDREVMDGGTYRPAAPLRGDIVLDDVSFEYDKDSPVLYNISFAVKPGQTVALLGPTGSGKSSLINLLARFYDYEGSIRLDGVELRDYARQDLRQQIGIVEQEPFLFSRTIRENIAYGVHRKVSNEEIEAAARAAAVHDVIMTFPEGYDTLVGERGVTLSGGQKQRVTIARTLLKDPRILVFDDAVSAVDTETEALIHAALERLAKGRTTFIIAHRIQTVMRADIILVLDKGRVIQHGTHRELMRQPGIYRRIYDLQARVEDDVTTVQGKNGKNGSALQPAVLST
ncbi:MAG: putative multidrug export ATP-binding/permease protein [Anaerolineae bacterium]|nr:putative multidrug export ATP-binding/permease protein [Anaerolineae bacterium]